MTDPAELVSTLLLVCKQQRELLCLPNTRLAWLGISGTISLSRNPAQCATFINFNACKKNCSLRCMFGLEKGSVDMFRTRATGVIAMAAMHTQCLILFFSAISAFGKRMKVAPWNTL